MTNNQVFVHGINDNVSLVCNILKWRRRRRQGTDARGGGGGGGGDEDDDDDDEKEMVMIAATLVLIRRPASTRMGENLRKSADLLGRWHHLAVSRSLGFQVLSCADKGFRVKFGTRVYVWGHLLFRQGVHSCAWIPGHLEAGWAFEGSFEGCSR